jgi:hypothetical protein
VDRRSAIDDNDQTGVDNSGIDSHEKYLKGAQQHPVIGDAEHLALCFPADTRTPPVAEPEVDTSSDDELPHIQAPDSEGQEGNEQELAQGDPHPPNSSHTGLKRKPSDEFENGRKKSTKVSSHEKE